MVTNIFLQQLAQRVDGDRKAMTQTLEILRSMIDRKLWKQMESSTELPTDFEQIETLFEKYNIFFRSINLTDGWWRVCTGYMLGFTADDDTPVTLLPGFTDYTFINPKTGKSMRASKSSHLLKKKAVIACFPFSDGELTVKGIMRYAVNCLCKYDFIYSLAACICVILLTMFTPYVCKLIFAEVIPSGDSVQIVPIATLLASAAVGLAMVQIARNLVVVRIKDKVEHTLQTAFMSRLLLLPATFAKKYSPGDLSNRILSISRVSSNLTVGFLSAILTFLFSGIMFVQFFIYGGPLFFTGITVILLQLVSYALVFYYTRKVQLNVNTEGSHLVGTLFALFSGIQKLKTTGAEFRAFHQWAKAYAPSEMYSCHQPIASFYINGISYCMKLLPMIVTMGAAWYYGLSLSDYIAYCAVLMLVNEAMIQLQNITKHASRILPEVRLCQPLLAAIPEFKEDSQVVKSITGQIEIRGLKFRCEPGKEHRYESMTAAILGVVIERATGKRYADYLSEKVWKPLQMELPAFVNIDSKKHDVAHAFGGITLTMKDLAKIGRLYLHQGVWNGQRIVSEEWSRQSGAYSTDNDCYHFNWYNLKSTGSGKPPYPGYYALGINAQVLYVNPYKNLIMVRMGMTNRKYVFIPELFEQLSNFGLF